MIQLRIIVYALALGDHIHLEPTLRYNISMNAPHADRLYSDFSHKNLFALGFDIVLLI